MVLKGKNLANYLNKYSDLYISNYFFVHLNSSTQLSVEYYGDFIKQKKLITYIVDRHIQYRDALIDPDNPVNARIIINHRKYFHDPSEKANGQLRGPQSDLADKMFLKAAKEGNGIENTNLSGVVLGDINTKNTHNVLYPSVLNIASPFSFRQGIELCNAKLLSSATGHRIIYTNDDVSNFPKGKSMINNMPASQKICDYLRVVPITPISTSNAQSSFVFLQEDDKKKTLNAFLNNSDIQQNVSVGTVDPKEERDAVISIAKARIAMMGVIPTSTIHVDPHKNKDVNLILKKIAQTGKVEDAKELVKFPLILSNRHVDS